MSAISQKSITGITSITTPAGVDNQLTLHVNDTSEALKLDHAGNIHIHNHVNTTGISSASNFKTGSSNLHSSGLSAASIDVGSNIKLGNAGVITATSFVGDGSDLTNLPAGLGTALSATATSPLNKMYYTNAVLGIAATTTVDVPASASAAYTQYADINIATDADLIIADGDDLIPDVLGLADFGTFGGGTAGRLRVSSISNHTANGAPTVQHGLVVTGVCTATSFAGDGSALTGLSGVSVANQADNRLITATGTTDALNGESNLTFDGTDLSLTATDGKIKLKDGNSYIQFLNTDKSFKFVNAWGAGEFIFDVNGGERLRINSDGKVGIATDTGSGLINTRHAGTNQQIFHFKADLGSSNGRSINLFTPDTDNTNAPFRFQTGNGFLFQCDSENVFTIHADRKIGINETDPDTKLHISHSSPTEDIIRLEATPVSADTGERSRIVFHVNQSNGQAAKLAHIASHTLNNWGGELAFNTKPANGTPNQILSETMRLHADGYVTKPRQPSFAAYRAQNDYTLNNSIFTFNATKHNVGGHFSTSTHRFTAPVDGRYLFNFWAIYVSNVTNAYYTIRINGSAGNGMYTHMTKQNSAWNHVSSSYIFDLNQNDYVDMFSNSNVGWHGNSWQLFSGQLLS